MTAFSFFGEQLFVLYTAVGHVGLVLATWATAALGFTLRHRPWARLPPPARSSAMRIGVAAAGVVGLTLAAGLRVGGTAYAPAEPMFWETLTALVSCAGLVLTAYAAGSGLAGAVNARQGAAPPLAAEGALEPVEAAVRAYERLAAATERLRASEQEATARAKAVADGVAAAEYVKAAEAIRHRLQLAEELRASTAAAVLRLACGAPVRRLLEHRPDQTLKRLNEPGSKAPLGGRVDAALSAVREFLREVEGARAQLADERAGAAGSVARRLGIDASERAKPFDTALAELATTYGRVAHRLEALRLRVGADADAGAVAAAAVALTGQAPAPPKDVVEVALEMTQAEQSAVSALAALGAEPVRISDVVVQASAALARGEGDDEAMADVLRVMRQEMER